MKSKKKNGQEKHLHFTYFSTLIFWLQNPSYLCMSYAVFCLIDIEKCILGCPKCTSTEFFVVSGSRQSVAEKQPTLLPLVLPGFNKKK